MSDDTLGTWQLEPGDLVIVDGYEVEILDKEDDDENPLLVNLRVFNHDANDVEVIPVLWDSEHTTWGL